MLKTEFFLTKNSKNSRKWIILCSDKTAGGLLSRSNCILLSNTWKVWRLWRGNWFDKSWRGDVSQIVRLLLCVYKAKDKLKTCWSSAISLFNKMWIPVSHILANCSAVWASCYSNSSVVASGVGTTLQNQPLWNRTIPPIPGDQNQRKPRGQLGIPLSKDFLAEMKARPLM